MTASPTDAVPGDVGLPSEETIAKLISGAPFPSTKSLSKARAILSLIRPAFEAKERELENAAISRNGWKIAAETHHDRALSAEAKLAQAVEDKGPMRYADGREVLFFASYCGDDTKGCTDQRPCAVCLGNSNVFRVTGKIEYVRTLSPDWLTETPLLPDDHWRKIETRVGARLKRKARAIRARSAARGET